MLPEVTRLDNGIISLTYPSRSHLTLDLMEKGFQRIEEIAEGPCLLLVVGSGVKYADYDALKFTATDRVARIVEAQAIVTKTFIERLLGDLYLKTHPTPFPCQCFTDEAKAQQWLLSLTESKKVAAN